MHTVIVLLTRDLRVSDNPALESAVRQAERVVPLFVLDPRLPAAERRFDFLAECRTDLRGSLRRLGGDLVIRVGTRSSRPSGWRSACAPPPRTRRTSTNLIT